MAVTLTTENTVLGVLLPKGDTARLATNIATVVLGTLLLTLCTKVSVLQVPVPITLQTFAVAALAAAFGWRIAVATVVLYILEGLAGLPVFAYGGGPAYVLSPSFGFILGFVPMAYVIGRATDLGASGRPLVLFAIMLAAHAMLYAIGFLWLLAVSGWIVNAGGTLPSWLDADNLVGSAFAGAVQPFIVWDILKMALAALTVSGGWTLLKRRV